MSPAAPPASTHEALEMLTSAMSYLAHADPAQMVAEEQDRCLATLEEVDAMETAARASVLGGFTAERGYYDDAAYSPRSWLIHQTRITRGAAAGHIALVRRARAHPRMVAALATGQMSESWARTLCGWTDKLPQDCRDQADEILAGAACQGLALRDLAALAAEMQSRADPGDGDDDPGKVFEDRAVRLETTFRGAGVLSGDVTPACAAVLTTVLDALSAPRGAEDIRTHAQRYHDALEEAARRLVTAGLLPERAGQPAKVIAHISLADLIDLDAGSVLRDKWTEQARAQWAAHRAAASVSGSDGGAWLEGDAAKGFACDASITPVVMGEVNSAVLEDLVRLCVELAGYGPGYRQNYGRDDAEGAAPPAPLPPPAPVPPTSRGRDALEREIIGKAVALLSGPGGLASFLRWQQLGGRLAGPSLPLDVGVSRHIPAAIRNAVIQRD
ncbi:MAG: 13E12 repeat family protein [Actinomycetota bacterium]|nr:13E12 repeat family protein [Actinomycetota bacterium]